ncbi:MAG: hypothetical protein RHS_0790 [Robinsoniella sp. RHS]|nr:MAG: hypothetical protein RHS_0790 [Robinsoniella sp. RHS]
MDKDATGMHQLQTIELEKPPKPIFKYINIMDIKIKAIGINIISFLNKERLNFKFSASKYVRSIIMHAPFLQYP